MRGKVAIITASSTGIGKSIAEEMAEKGCSVIISSRNKQHVDKAVEELTSKGYSALGVICHVGKKEDRLNLIKETVAKFGRIDYLVCNAAVSTVMGNPLEGKIQAIKKMWDINYHSVYELIQETLPELRKQKNSSIVIISSYTAYDFSPIISHYAITKTALLALTKVLAKQLMNDDIRINAVAPGLIKTDFSGVLWKQNQEQARKQMKVKRLGVPSDISKTVRFLLSEDAGYITGECVAVVGKPVSRL